MHIHNGFRNKNIILIFSLSISNTKLLIRTSIRVENVKNRDLYVYHSYQICCEMSVTEITILLRQWLNKIKFQLNLCTLSSVSIKSSKSSVVLHDIYIKSFKKRNFFFQNFKTQMWTRSVEWPIHNSRHRSLCPSLQHLHYSP